MNIPFTKAHGAKNDFLLTWTRDVPVEADLRAMAISICNRNTGVGADGWILIDERLTIRILNSDGSEPEISGNGTRCAAAFLMTNGWTGQEIRIVTGAGVKQLRLIERHGAVFDFEMNMGRPRVVAGSYRLQLPSGVRDVTMIDVGNPQCAVPVENFDFNWAAVGAEIERHSRFPNRTNVSFVRRLDAHTIEARFFERGAGATMSSGTGATGAAMCAIERKLAASPVCVMTQAGPLEIADRGDFYLRGPAEIVAEGTFFYPVSNNGVPPAQQ